jgi:uncharacterized protein YcbK (DUF882 family)
MMTDTPPELHKTRRGLLILGALAAPAIISPESTWAAIGQGFCPPGSGGGGTSYDNAFEQGPIQDYSGAVPPPGPPDRSVAFTEVHNGDTFNQPYLQGGKYIPAALERMNYVLRDWRNQQQINMDPGLLDIFYDLTRMLALPGPILVTSGYRSPSSNATVGGARQSYHMRGMASDISHPSKTPADFQAAARALKRGGVGSYRTFTHVDTGPVRTWNG